MQRSDVGVRVNSGLAGSYDFGVCHVVAGVERQRTGRNACPTYGVAETITGSAVLLQPFISILPSGRAVPVIMPVVLNGVATLP